MSLIESKKINHLINDWPSGTVYLSSWLKQLGISGQLLNRYKKSGWLVSIGSGAVKRVGDEVGYQGAIYALQSQRNSSIHVGGKSALELQGRLHYLKLKTTSVSLFGDWKEHLPLWFSSVDWGVPLEYHLTSFLPADLELMDLGVGNFTIKISSPLRAFFECLYLAPEKQDLMECYELMEGLNNLRPMQVQKILEACESIKVKRLFVFMAEKAGHAWFKHVDLSKVNLGTGKRSIVMGGQLDSKYQITLPRELA
ncbi:MAG: type IV toxin-antitoxin system AbiEi family antitoxin [Betaproteobacteria bacterium]|jgi:hypothetical protein